mmetsp:Transcript_13739/g.45397  ORF Transcript_13739/g.45397 Transcript_13739/m.45397 type:complete len:314 (+) Transcript_13739:584-1525(+)
MESSSASNRVFPPPSFSSSSSDESSYFPRAPRRGSNSFTSSSLSRAASTPGACAWCTASSPPFDLIRARENKSISEAPVAPSSSWPTKPSAVRTRSFARSLAFFFLSRRSLAATDFCKSLISSRSLLSSFSGFLPSSFLSSKPVMSSSDSLSVPSSPVLTTPPRSAAFFLPSSLRVFLTARRHLSRFLKSTLPSTPRSAQRLRISGVVAGWLSRSMNPSFGGTTPFLFDASSRNAWNCPSSSAGLSHRMNVSTGVSLYSDDTPSSYPLRFLGLLACDKTSMACFGPSYSAKRCRGSRRRLSTFFGARNPEQTT